MWLRVWAAFLVLAAGLRAAATLDDAIALYQAKQYPAAREALEKIVAAEPNNAAACYYLGMTIRRRGDEKALDDAVGWMEKASSLEPNNPRYLADYGGMSLLLANQNKSYGAATKGRDAMEKALKLDPDDVEARSGLFQFYERAPWPLGSSTKAAAHLQEIRKRDPQRALVLSVVAKTRTKDFAAAFKICENLLGHEPLNYFALYHYGRTAAISGQNLELGLARLQQTLALTPPGPSAPTPSDIWNRIGNIQQQRGRSAEARQAYQTALDLDPSNRNAAEALAKLK